MRCLYLVLALLAAIAGRAADVTIRGTVEGPDGKPLPGAHVTALRFDENEPLDPFKPQLDVVTDAEGRFQATVAPGEYFVTGSNGTLNF